MPFLGGVFGNPSSAHAFGRVAREALDDAHERLARSIGADAREIVFTSGGTEANNLALKGAAWAGKSRGHRIVTTPVEHHAVGHALAYLEKFGFEVVEVPVDRYGRVDPDDVERGDHRPHDPRVGDAREQRGRHDPADRRGRPRSSARTARAPVPRRRRPGRAAGSTSTSTPSGRTSSRSRAHKAEGPKGTGALWIRRGTHILAQQHGGSQERHRRAGTENVAGAVGMARRSSSRRGARDDSSRRSEPCATGSLAALLAVDGVELTGHPAERLPAHRCR